MNATGRILRADELQPRPWRNGLGVTRELALHPPGADADDFLWRCSVADVVGPAPFSLFPGIDRIIVLLDGAGFRMTLDGQQEHALTSACEPFAFAGEAAVDVQLAGGPTRDFNLMLRRGAATGRIDVWRDTGTQRCPDDLVLLYLARGQAGAPAGRLDAGDSWLPAASGAQAVELVEGAVALAVRVQLGG